MNAPLQKSMLLKWIAVFYLALFVIFILLILLCILKCVKTQRRNEESSVFVIASPKREAYKEDLPPSYSQANTLKITEIKAR